MIEVLPQLRIHAQKAAEDSGLIVELLDMSARQAENDGTHSHDERALALTILTDLWLHFTSLVDS